jgi:hypothetical protein
MACVIVLLNLVSNLTMKVLIDVKIRCPFLHHQTLRNCYAEGLKCFRGSETNLLMDRLMDGHKNLLKIKNQKLSKTRTIC